MAPVVGASRGATPRTARAAVALAAFLLLPPPFAGPLLAQHRLVAPSGREIAFPEDSLRAMLDTTRALRRDLEEDPRILYYTGTGPAVPAAEPAAALPWNAVEVLTDSTATIRTPGNLREADRAYANYAVLRMRRVRMDPDVPCDSLVRREVEAVSGFVDGWVVTRTLFGGPPYAPLDELVFARREGLLPGLIADAGDPQLGGCLEVWSEANPAAIEAYRRWRREAFQAAGGRPAAAVARAAADAGNNPSAAP